MSEATATLIIDRETIAARIDELGDQLDQAVGQHVPVLVGVLTGAVPFLADLARACPFDLEVDFLALTRFGSAGQIDIAFDCSIDLTDRHVVIVEDIVDTGLSLRSLRAMVEIRRPASVSTCTLIDKGVRRLVDVPLEFRGFEVGDEFLVGYGMDWDQKYRHLPDIWAVTDLAAFGANPPTLERRSDVSTPDSVEL